MSDSSQEPVPNRPTPSSGRLEDLPRRQKIFIAVIVLGSVIAGIVIHALDGPTQSMVTTVIVACVLAIGSVRSVLDAYVMWRAGRRLLAIFLAILSLLLALLLVGTVARR